MRPETDHAPLESLAEHASASELATVDLGALARSGAPLPADQNPALVYLAGLAEGSRRTMRGALVAIATVFGVHPSSFLAPLESFPWQALRYQHVQAIRSHFADRGSYRTANKLLSALRGVLREAGNLGLTPFEDVERACRVKSIKGFSLPKGRLLTEAERHALYGVCDLETPGGARDAAYLTISYFAGSRRAETALLDLASIRFEEDGAEVRFLGKGNKERTVFVDHGSLGYLKAWIVIRGEEPGPFLLAVDKHGKLRIEKNLSEEALWALCKRLANRAHIEPFSPHDLRRSCISDLLDAGADITTVSSIAGHASVATTAGYDRRGERAKRKAATLLHVPFKGTKP